MDRRQAIRSLFAAGVGVLSPTSVIGAEWIENPYVEDYGALPPLYTTNAPLFRKVYGSFARTLPTKNVFLFHDLQKTIGEIKPHYQPRMVDGGEGDCVGHATAMACDVLAAVNIVRFKKPEDFVAKASVEAIYWGSRNEIGQGMITDGGSHCVWGAQFVQKFGVLHRLAYSAGGKDFDLSGYSPQRSRLLRNVGVPDDLEPVARLHPVRQITKLKSGMEVLQAVAAGQPVVIGSSYAFPNVRDDAGFTTPFFGRTINVGIFRHRQIQIKRKKWRHAMVVTGAILEGKRQGGIIQNSMGDWNSGPQPYDMPDGAFAVETPYLDLMVKDYDDTWALSGYVGHQANLIRKYLE